MNTSTDSSIDSDHLLHSFNNSSDSQISKNNNNNNNNNDNNFNFKVRDPPSPNTSSESSRGYWPDHVLNGGPLIRRVTEGEEGSTGTSESEFDDGVGGSDDDMDIEEVMKEEDQAEPIEESYSNRIEGSRRNTITNSSNSRPHSASHPIRPSTSTHLLSNPLIQHQSDGLISRDSETKRSSKRGETLPSSIDNISVNSSRNNGSRDNESSDGSRRHRSKGKERERRNNRTFTSPAFDPLDPLSSLSHPSSSSNVYSQSSSATPGPSRVTYSSYDNSATSSRLNNDQSSYIPSPTAPQSLQQLLQTVDLSAALLLVQTLQKTQQQSQQIPTPPPAPKATLTSFSDSSYNHERDRTTSSNYFSDQTNAMSISSADTHTPLLPPASLSPPHSPSKISYTNNLEISSTRPRAATFLPSYGANSSTATEKKDRRRSLSFNFGAGNVSKKLRISSSNGKDNLQKVKERILDDRAYLGEQGRDFEEQIAKVHLNLSPSTMRRAQNCSKYLSLRYARLYLALESPDLPLPNSLAVSRWRNEKEEADRRYRRAQLGTSGRSRAFGFGGKDDGVDFDGNRSIDGVRSDGGSSINGQFPKSLKASTIITTSVYGPRRNTHPKAWEIYPDEISEFVETGGRIVSPEVLELGSGRAISARSTSIGSSYQQGMSGLSQVRTPNQTAPNSPTSTKVPLPTSPALDNSINRSRHPSGVEGSVLSRSTTGRSSLEVTSPISRNSLSNGSSYQFPPQSTTSTKSPLATSTGSTSRFNSPKVATELTYEPLSPRVSITSVSNGTHSQTLSISKQNEGGGRLRHSLTRRLDKIRGKGSEIDLPSDAGTIGISSSRSRRGSLPISTDPSESEMISKLGGNHMRTNTVAGELSVLSSGSSFRRKTSKMSDTSAEGGYRSSGGEENSRKLVKGRWKPNKWQGFGGRNVGGDKEMVSLEEGVQLGAPFVAKKRILRIEESDDDDYKVPREILDLGDEEFSKLTVVLRQVKVQLSHVDSFLPRVPTQLNQYLESITQHDTMTFKSLNIPVQYSYPRLTASVISQLANRKVQQFSPQFVSDRVATSSSPDTSSDSSSEDSDEERDRSFSTNGNKAHLTTAASIRFRPPRRDSQARHVSGGHTRRATDPISKGVPTGRARSQTLASTVTGLGIRSGAGGGTAIRDLTHPSGLRVDRLALLEKAISDLEKGKRELEGEIETTMEFQEIVRKEINDFFIPVDQLIQAINSTYELKLQRVEKHFFRLNTSRTKSGFSVDILWGLLSYVITIVLLLFWAFATIWNFIYAIIKTPFIFLRWLFFPF